MYFPCNTSDVWVRMYSLKNIVKWKESTEAVLMKVIKDQKLLHVYSKIACFESA
jgi:hypothetical protein